MWLDHLGANRLWMSLWWLAEVSDFRVQLTVTKVLNARWARVLTGRTVTVARLSDEWLRQFDRESGKHRNNL
jgi:hypothetical protein